MSEEINGRWKDFIPTGQLVTSISFIARDFIVYNRHIWWYPGRSLILSRRLCSAAFSSYSLKRFKKRIFIQLKKKNNFRKEYPQQFGKMWKTWYHCLAVDIKLRMIFHRARNLWWRETFDKKWNDSLLLLSRHVEFRGVCRCSPHGRKFRRNRFLITTDRIHPITPPRKSFDYIHCQIMPNESTTQKTFMSILLLREVSPPRIVR